MGIASYRKFIVEIGVVGGDWTKREANVFAWTMGFKVMKANMQTLVKQGRLEVDALGTRDGRHEDN